MATPISSVSQKKIQDTEDVRVLLSYMRQMQNDIIKLQKDLSVLASQKSNS